MHICAELVKFGLEFLQKCGRNVCELNETEEANHQVHTTS